MNARTVDMVGLRGFYELAMFTMQSIAILGCNTA